VSCELCGSVYEREICTDCGSQRGRRRRRDEDDQRSEDKQMMRTKGGYIQVHTATYDTYLSRDELHTSCNNNIVYNYFIS
jgi:hypothetical protein